MSLDYLIRPSARADIDAAFTWYEAQSSGRGDEFLAEPRRFVDDLRQTPELYGRVFGEVRAAPLPSSNYVVYYRIEPNRISVLAVQHKNANPRKQRR